MNVEGQSLVPAPTFTILDKDSAKLSLQKLTLFDIETVICYHGGLFKDNPNQRIVELANH